MTDIRVRTGSMDITVSSNLEIENYTVDLLLKAIEEERKTKDIDFGMIYSIQELPDGEEYFGLTADALLQGEFITEETYNEAINYIKKDLEGDTP